MSYQRLENQFFLSEKKSLLRQVLAIAFAFCVYYIPSTWALLQKTQSLIHLTCLLDLLDKNLQKKKNSTRLYAYFLPIWIFLFTEKKCHSAVTICTAPLTHTWTEIKLNLTGVYLESKAAMRTPNIRASKRAPTWYVCTLAPTSLKAGHPESRPDPEAGPKGILMLA